MKIVPIAKSSNIEGCGYDPETKKLIVMFKNGSCHRYSDVPQEHYDGLMGAESAGKYFHANIRNAFKSERHDVDGADEGTMAEGGPPAAA